MFSSNLQISCRIWPVLVFCSSRLLFVGIFSFIVFPLLKLMWENVRRSIIWQLQGWASIVIPSSQLFFSSSLLFFCRVVSNIFFIFYFTFFILFSSFSLCLAWWAIPGYPIEWKTCYNVGRRERDIRFIMHAHAQGLKRRKAWPQDQKRWIESARVYHNTFVWRR